MNTVFVRVISRKIPLIIRFKNICDLIRRFIEKTRHKFAFTRILFSFGIFDPTFLSVVSPVVICGRSVFVRSVKRGNFHIRYRARVGTEVETKNFLRPTRIESTVFNRFELFCFLDGMNCSHRVKINCH